MADTRKAVVQMLESLQDAGVEQIPRSENRPDGPAASAPSEVSVVAPPSVESPVEVVNSPLGAPAMPASAADQLQIVQQEVAECTLCQELASKRTQTVFGSGNPNPRLCFMGEAPGADEDAQGLPFVGRAGKKLTEIIHACTLTRDDVYILNTIKCRPPGNRDPSPVEASNCRSFLDRQLDILKPEFICCLGSVAAKNLLDTTTAIGKLRGTFHDYRGIKVMATYHPAYLLRNPAARRPVWEDMKMLMNAMGIEIPQGK